MYSSKPSPTLHAAKTTPVPEATEDDSVTAPAPVDSTPANKKSAVVKNTVLQVLVFLVTLGVATGHHFYYSCLNGKPVENQSWTLRSGIALTLAGKLLFGFTIGKSFAQEAWRTVRTRYLSLGTVDRLFKLTNDPLSFLSFEVLSKTVLAVVIAAMYWSLVLLPVIVPASISVVNTEHIGLVQSLDVPGLNFSRLPVPGAGSGATTTVGDDSNSVPLVTMQGVGAGFYDYQSVSPPARSYISNVVYSKRIPEINSPCGANYSFSQTFWGPAYKCDDIDYAKSKDPENPFCTQNDMEKNNPCGTNTFNFAGSGGGYLSRTWYSARNSSGNATEWIPGGWADGKLWIAYQYLPPQYRNGSGQAPFPESVWERHVVRCQSYNATYNIRRTYRSFQQGIKTNITYLNPVNYTSVTKDSGDRYRYAFPAYATHDVLYSILSGEIHPNAKGTLVDTTGLRNMALVDSQAWGTQDVQTGLPAPKPLRDLRAALEELHANVTVGLLSLGMQLVYAQKEPVGPVETRELLAVWHYDWVILVAAYGVAVVFEALALGLSIWAVRRNGGVSDLGFLRVAAATTIRGGAGDVMVGWEDAEDPVPKAVKKSRVRFGTMWDPVRRRHGLGFSVRSEVREGH